MSTLITVCNFFSVEAILRVNSALSCSVSDCPKERESRSSDSSLEGEAGGSEATGSRRGMGLGGGREERGGKGGEEMKQ